MPLPAMVLPAAIMGGASLAGNIASSAFGMWQADKQMRFQRDMSNTAHQREVEDLGKAGLNPVLSAKLGGASSPPGASAPSPDFSNSARAAQEAMNLQSNTALQQAQARNLDTQSLDTVVTQQARIDQLLAQAHSALESGNLSAANKDSIREQIKSLVYQRALLKSQSEHSALGLSKAERQSEFYKGPLGKSATMRSELGKLPGAASSAYEAATYIGNKYDRWRRNRQERRREMERNHPPPGGGEW